MSSVWVWLRQGEGEGPYHWCVSHPDIPSPPPPPSLPALHVACVCILACASWWEIGVGAAWKIYIWNNETGCVCVCVTVHGVHIHALCVHVWLVKQRWVIHWPAFPVTMGHKQQVPHLPMSPILLFFFNSKPTSLPYPLPPPPTPPPLFPLWLTDDSHPIACDITAPLPTLCCGESYCTLRLLPLIGGGKPECHPFIHKFRLRQSHPSVASMW